ncbi:MAG: alginate lyase family protein [Deltaproteobacteria bacterium]|nr:alginate lyase family protein [Deltaproteobacteria bacterium]
MKAFEDRSLRWLLRRLRRVGPAEALHRLRQELWWAQVTPSRIGPRRGPPEESDAPLLTLHHPWVRRPDGDPAAYVARADRVLAGEVPGLGGGWRTREQPVQWHRDPATGRTFPRVRADRVRYRDPAVDPDIRATWEGMRHHHVVWLAQGFAWSGDPVYVAALEKELSEFFTQCPFPEGPAWTSALEVAVRLANWAAAWQLLGAGISSSSFQHKWSRAVAQSLEHVRVNLSMGSSANNHLVGELGGLVVAGALWAPGELEDAVPRLEAQLLLQIAADGSSREGSTGYLGFTLSWGLLAGLAAQGAGQPFAEATWDRLAAAVGFLRALSEGHEVPDLGDWDGGQVLQFGVERLSPTVLARVGAAVFGGGPEEEALWWTSVHDAPPRHIPFAKRTSLDAGLHWVGSSTGVRALLRFGQIGGGALGAHGHADTLSVLLWADGVPVLVDRGTGSYLADPSWRAHFRGTAAHNTATVDGVDSSVASGAFQWEQRAVGELLEGTPTSVRAQHDGYMRLGVMHERTLLLEGDTLRVEDTFRCEGRHDLALHWHLAPGWSVSLDGARARTELGETGESPAATWVVEAEGPWTVHEGEEEPQRMGWHSAGFGTWAPAPTLCQRLSIHGTTTVRTQWTRVR